MFNGGLKRNTARLTRRKNVAVAVGRVGFSPPVLNSKRSEPIQPGRVRFSSSSKANDQLQPQNCRYQP